MLPCLIRGPAGWCWCDCRSRLPALAVFQRGFVLSAPPATAARVCFALALGCGLGVALLAGPSLVRSLRRTHVGTAETF